jgi:hypothetical protein
MLDAVSKFKKINIVIKPNCNWIPWF